MRFLLGQSLSTRSSIRAALAVSALAALALTGCSAGGSVTGIWGEVDVQGKPSLEFGTEGVVTGTDGCNRIMGSYTANGGEIAFGNLASTMMFCEGVDTWLTQASTATLSGDTLTVFNEGGSEIGTLERAKS